MSEKWSNKMQTLTTAQLKEQVHAAIRAGDRAKVASLTAEIKRRIAAAGVTPPAQLTTDPAKLAALKAQREAILRGEA